MIPRNDVLSLLFQSRERPFGRTWQYWTTRWWQWFLSIPKMDNHTKDNFEEKSYVERSDPNVWFLASTIGGRVERTIRIHSGKAILFPVINVTISNSEDPTLSTDTEMITYVTRHMNDIVKKQASIDGEDLFISEKFRVQTPPFNFSYASDNIFGAREGPTRGVGDGYWIFMRPLKPGKHNITTYGSCMMGKIQIAATIQLLVENSPS